jgi:hypothetical protein
MQSPQSISAEELAQMFYNYRDALASDFGFQSNEGCITWDEIQPASRNLMVASARLVLRELADRQCGCAITGLRHSA